MSISNGKIFQVFECADGEEIHRLYVTNTPGLDVSKIDVVDANGASILKETMFLDAAKGEALSRCLSLRLPQGACDYRVTHVGRTLSRLSGRAYQKLVFFRNYAMVNAKIDGGFAPWLDAHPVVPELTEAELTSRPLFSVVVPLFNTPLPYLREMLDSVLAQTYSNWELLLVNASVDNAGMKDVLAGYDDPRIKVLEVPKNLGIAGNTNVGVSAAGGDYVGFFDHDDVLDKNCLLEYAIAVEKNPQIDLLYCDEDNFEEDVRHPFAPRFKPDFNLGLLHSHNYVTHMLTVSRYILDRVELSPDYTSGAQDYDMTLKAYEVARAICHVPKLLYHWRMHPGSTNGGIMDGKPYAIEASERALADHFRRTGVDCSVAASDYISCVFDMTYKPASAADYQVYAWGSEKSFTAALTEATACEAPYAVFVRDTVRGVDEEFLAKLCSVFQRPEVGIVGAKLFFADGLVQHAGVCVNANDDFMALNQGFADKMGGGYMGFAECECDYSAVLPDCFAVRCDLLAANAGQVTGYKHANDAMFALCEKVREAGFVVCVSSLAAATNLVGAEVTGKALNRSYKATLPEVLGNPNLMFETGYPQLDFPRDAQADWNKKIKGALLRRLHIKR